MNEATLDYARQHATDDVRQLALRPVPEGVDVRAALTQIEGRQLAARKLPTWAATDGLLFPPRLALEQCSSEATAAYKRHLVQRILQEDGRWTAGNEEWHFMDLTAGFGVDFAAIAPLFARATYVERQEKLCSLARANLKYMACAHAHVRCTTAEQVLDELSTAETPSLRLLMLDPARRDAAGRKVALIEDCTPDVCTLQEQLRTAADYTLIKLSPMLDLTAALRSLRGITEAHVVSVGGECKELLLVMAAAGQTAVDEVPINCIDLPATSPSAAPIPEPFRFTRTAEMAAPVCLAEQLGPYLFEPNASLLKAGAYRIICQRFPVRQLAPTTHLYTSVQPVPGFPGRRWQITGQTSFSKHDLRRFLADVPSAELTVRGFPVSTATLRRQLRLPEGGAAHLVATTLADGSKVLLRVEKCE